MPHQSPPDPVFFWQSFSRFVSVHQVQSGWLVIWGTRHDLGARRELSGQCIYVDFNGVRNRVGRAVRDLTRSQTLVDEAIMFFDRKFIPESEIPHS